MPAPAGARQVLRSVERVNHHGWVFQGPGGLNWEKLRAGGGAVPLRACRQEMWLWRWQGTQRPGPLGENTEVQAPGEVGTEFFLEIPERG